ncbi:MAG: hypothetical protein ACE5DR_04315, partial [Thermodesulfobacteriota bacterium]
NKEQAVLLSKYILDSGDKLFYVHCYLGRHRVEVFKEAFSKALQERSSHLGAEEALVPTPR